MATVTVDGKPYLQKHVKWAPVRLDYPPSLPLACCRRLR